MVLRGHDVGSLSLLAAAAKQDNDLVSAASEIDPISGTQGDSELMHAITDRLAVAKVPKPDTNETCTNGGSGSDILDRIDPLRKRAPMACSKETNLHFSRHPSSM